jgi:translation initiation factor 2B subunit (eIF-2B alpha/beta/delta family)
MNLDWKQRVRQIADDRESGSSEILASTIDILRDRLAAGEHVVESANALCLAQPTMAPVWNAARAAVAALDDPDAFEQFAQRVARAPQAVVRFAVDVLTTGLAANATIRLATLSYSSSVAKVGEALARERPVEFACTEGRPVFEGRTLASRLAAAGCRVRYFTDAAIGHALDGCDAVIVGADAVSPRWFVNKSGTRLLAAAASHRGVPVYVLAGREKFVSADVESKLEIVEGALDEVWPDAPANITVRNPYFERIPLDLIAGVITDVGLLGSDSVAELC